ncbi:MAG: exodeoxyribonuclease VII large subunit, partial [Pseudomonadales bacterium]|nr:exodeoxyribonuclease VII large subunit [Pseudomonadales bacterium]
MTDVGLSNREILTVSALNRSARRLLEGEFPMVFVEGEISNFTRPSSGHWYLTLKDDNAQLRCAMFVNRNRLVRFTPKNGMQVVVRGRISLYEGRGEFQMIAEHMEEAGDGALRRAFDKLKAKLEAEGLFDPDARLPIPAMPNHIAVITSPTGAAIRDVLSVLRRRFPAITVSVLPVQVQGEDSAPQIVKALDFANRYDAEPFDVILLTRGGGSMEDLWSFNTEPVARAIHASALPVVCAVGHETDFTIADFAADLRAPTPSAAAEVLSPDRIEWLESFNRAERTLTHRMKAMIERHESHVGHIAKRLRHPGRRLEDLGQQLDHLEMRLSAAFKRYTERFRLADIATRLQGAMSRRLERAGADLRLTSSRVKPPLPRIASLSVELDNLGRRNRSAVVGELRQTSAKLSTIESRLTGMDPQRVLERGYAI